MELSARKNYIIEFLRVICTLGVVVAHTYVVFFKNADPTYDIFFQISCVDFFFMISGYFMAVHFGISFDDPKNDYVHYVLSRIKRLWPLLLIAAVLELPTRFFLFHRLDLIGWPSLVFLGDIQNFPGWGPIWYISTLFWGTMILSYLLSYHKKISVYLVFPVTIFITLSIMSQWGCANLSSFIKIGGWFSTGFLRTFCGMCIGAEAFFLGGYIKKYIEKFNESAIKFFSIFIEFFFIVVFLYQMLKQRFDSIDFLFYFAFSAFLVVMQLGQQKIMNVFNHRIWGKLAKITAVMYVSHFPVINIMKKISFMNKISDLLVYIIICSISVILSFLIYKIELFMEKKIHGFIFKAAE